MSVVVTDLRNTRRAASEISFDPRSPMTATNVQDAIVQANALPGTRVQTAVTAGMSPYSPAALDQVLLVDTSVGPVTINMPLAAARNGLALDIKDNTGNAATNAISVVMTGGETADGMTTFPIDSRYGRAIFSPKTSGYWVE